MSDKIFGIIKPSKKIFFGIFAATLPPIEQNGFIINWLKGGR